MLIAFCLGVSIQLVEMESVLTQGPATEFNKVVVVGEEKYLGTLGKLGQLWEYGRRPIIVESDQ